MRRVVARGWGAEQIEARYPGRRLTLWCNPEVTWAGAPVGGIQVSHMSDLDEPFTMPLRIGQKVTKQITVQPLTDEPQRTEHPALTPDEIVRMTDLDELKSLWKSHPDLRGFIESRVAEIKAATPDQEPGGSR